MAATPEQLVVITPKSVPHPCQSQAGNLPLELALVDRADPQRASAEAFVRRIFEQAYGARLDTFYPVLLCITRPEGSYAAVAGIRPAGGQSLFSEHYLDQPIETLLGAERRQVVEVGNLAPANAGQARWLIGAVTALLAGAGFSHVVFTAVPRLKNAFSRMGLPLVQLAEARAENLPDNLAQDWGSYYEHDPAVFSGDIQLGFHAFARLVASHPELRKILQKAYTAGAVFANRPTSVTV